VSRDPLEKRTLLAGLFGYALLIGVILLAQFLPVLRTYLGQVVIQVEFPELRTALGFVTPAGPGRKLVVFQHPGMVLFYACILVHLLYLRLALYQPGATGRILRSTFKGVLASSVSIASMVGMAEVMENSGMTDALARGLASGVGALFPLISPWIGALGSFITGSNTNSNVIFAALQMRTAELLGYAVPVILAAQTAGAALASVIAPTKVVVGTSTTGLAGREGEVMRRMGVYIGLLVVLISALAVIFSFLGS